MSSPCWWWRLDHGHDLLCYLLMMLLLDMTMELACIWTKCVRVFQLLCFRYLWTRVVITMWTLMYARYLWTTCEMDVTCGLLCWIMYDLGCMQVGLKSFVVSVDYRVYMGSSMTVWSLPWLLLYLCSYKLVGSIIASIGARFNIKHVICVFKTKGFCLQKSVLTTIVTYI